jgi:hypothetical protein
MSADDGEGDDVEHGLFGGTGREHAKGVAGDRTKLAGALKRGIDCLVPLHQRDGGLQVVVASRPLTLVLRCYRADRPGSPAG